MIIKHKLTMDLADYNANATIHTAQNDRYSRDLEIALLENGNAWVIPQNADVLIRYSKPDGTGGSYDALPDGRCAWKIGGNILTVALAPQVTTAPGAVRLSVTLVQEQIQISTFAVIIHVEKAVSPQAEESQDYYPMHGVPFEPAVADIPLVFFGDSLPQTKDNAVMTFRYVSKTKDIRGYCKTKAQGNSSMAYPKKNQTVTLYRDADCSEKLQINFKGWGPQNKFCFKANWIDLTHARNVVSARLWADVVKSRQGYETMPDLLRTSPNQGAVDGFPVKVYAGGIYQGRYTLNIPKDAWMANMDEDLDNHCILCGENYKSGCFRAEAAINESDWTDEIHGTVPDAIKARWNEAIRFVMNSTDAEFVSGIGDYFDTESLIDYYLFGLASCGLDAFGKNQLYMTYDGQKWYASMYDMDSTWGLWWTGERFVSSSYSRSDYQDFMDGEGNLLYIRLEALFADTIHSRWEELKHNPLSVSSILSRFEQFIGIAPDALVKEDYASTTAGGAFTGIPSQSTNNLQQIRAYAAERIAWVDQYLNGEAAEDSELLYEMAGATTFDGSSVCIDTGVQLFDTAKDFTIIVNFDGITPASGAYGYLLDTSVEENLDNSNLNIGYEEGSNFPKLRASGSWKHTWEDTDNGNWGNTWSNLQCIAIVYVGGVFSYGKYIKKSSPSTVCYIHPAEAIAYHQSNDTLKIGARKNYWIGALCDYWTGTVNTCRVYSRALTEAEVIACLNS